MDFLVRLYLYAIRYIHEERNASAVPTLNVRCTACTKHLHFRSDHPAFKQSGTYARLRSREALWTLLLSNLVE